MSDWIDQYSAALDQRDAREQAHKEYIDAYTKLADRTATLQARDTPPAQQPSSPTPPPKTTEQTRLRNPQKASSPDPETSETLTRLRTDLSTTQKARQALQTQLDTMTASLRDLQLTHQTSTTQLNTLQRQKADVERRLRDRDEELRGKTKLAKDAQDEMVALELQVHLAEEKAGELKKENEELVARWMRRMGEEAESLNRGSGWG